MYSEVCACKKFSIVKPGVVRVKYWSDKLPDDAPILADGDTTTRKPPKGIRVIAECPGISGACTLIDERFSCKDGIREYEVTLEFRELDGDEESTRELLTRALRLDLGGKVTIKAAQIDLLADTREVH